MIAALTSSLSAALALAVVAVVVLVALLDWGGPCSMRRRVALCLMAAGLVWAAPGRFLGAGAGIGDVLFLTGLLVLLIDLHGKAMLRRADALDGRLDGRLGPVVLHRGGLAPVSDAEFIVSPTALRRHSGKR